MCQPSRDDDVLGCEIDCTISAGRNLVAKDGTGLFKMGAKSTSDPYVTVTIGGTKFSQTEVGVKTLSPTYDHSFKFVLEGKAFNKDQSIKFAIFDRDRGAFDADDPMGEVLIPVRELLHGKVRDEWFPVQPCSGCSDATGELKIKVSTLLRRALTLQPEQSTSLGTGGMIAIGLGWDLVSGKRSFAEAAIDLDTACVALDFQGRVLTEECVYFAQLHSRSGAMRHTGDELEGDEDLGGGDDEVIMVELGRLPPSVCALYLIGTVASEGRTFADVKTAKMRLVNVQSGAEKCRFYPGTGGAHTAVFLGRIARSQPGAPWALQAIGEYDHTARDWGSLVPEMMLYSTDLVAGLKPDLSARVAIMRKGGVVRVGDYSPTGRVPEHLVLGLSWDITAGKNIDLDASAILLDAHLRQIDLVFFGKLGSSDGAIRHGGGPCHAPSHELNRPPPRPRLPPRLSRPAPCPWPRMGTHAHCVSAAPALPCIYCMRPSAVHQTSARATRRATTRRSTCSLGAYIRPSPTLASVSTPTRARSSMMSRMPLAISLMARHSKTSHASSWCDKEPRCAPPRQRRHSWDPRPVVAAESLSARLTHPASLLRQCRSRHDDPLSPHRRLAGKLHLPRQAHRTSHGHALPRPDDGRVGI